MPILNVILWFFCLGQFSFGRGTCPRECDCSLDERGRQQVLCIKGGLRDPIPIASIERNVEVFKISAPLEAPNFLTIGPIFQKFSHLEQLDIVGSNIPAIGKHSFWGLRTLRVLNLTRNNISHILEHNFRGLVNLLELHLDDNRIESMPSETFRHLQELKVLTLSRNQIHELVPRLFIMLGKLQELDLSENPLADLNPEVFKDVPNLRKFKCRFCYLANVNKLIYQLLVDLVELDLGENEFKYIRPEEFETLKKLEILKLDNNHLAVVTDTAFASNPNALGRIHMTLEKLDLSRNRLAKVTSRAFANLPSLRSLDLSYNGLEKLESGTFHSVADSLWSLNLSGNVIPMDELKFIIQILSKLTHLSLSDMRLFDIPLGLFAYHDNLKYLNLSGNRLSQLSPHLVTLTTRIQVLDLSRNRFRGLNEKTIVRLEKIPHLVLAENPWACDLCHIPPILNRVNKSLLGLAFRQLVCKSPYALAGRQVSTLQGNELKWCSGDSESFDPADENTSSVGVSGSLVPLTARTGMMVAVVVLTLFFATGLILLACVVYSRRRTDHYYTREERRNQMKTPYQNYTPVDSESCENGLYEVCGDVPRIKKKKVTIATIDEIVKYPELHILTNGA